MRLVSRFPLCGLVVLLAPAVVWATDPAETKPIETAAPTAAPAETPRPKTRSIWKDIERTVIKRVTLSGYRRLSYHSHTVNGDRSAFDTLNYYGQGAKKFLDVGQVQFEGRQVAGLFNFRGNLLDSRFTDPQGQQFSLDYERRGVTVNLGDIQGSLINSNRFASFSKSLRGAAVGVKTGRTEFKTLYSQVRGSARTVSISGANTTGPYYLQANQILVGTEQVRVDDRPQRLGDDYVINYEAGSITFVSRAIPPSSTIVVSFEALGFNERPGTLQAAGARYDMGRAGKIGITAMRQISRTGGGTSSRLEKFQGFGAPATPYFLQFEPLAGSVVTVRVNGILQRLGIDYAFDIQNPAVFYFNRFMPPSDNIDVIYTPTPRTTVDGDREVTGIDYEIPLGRKLNQGAINLSLAQGKLSKTVTPLNGSARSIGIRYTDGIATMRAEARKVPASFVGIETVGFNRNEDGYDIGLDLDPKGPMDFSFGRGNSSVQNRSVSGTGQTVFTNTRVTNLFADANYRFKTGEIWKLSHRRSRNISLGNASKLNESDFSANRNLGQWGLKTGLQRLEGANTRNGAQVPFRIDGVSLGTTYTPATWFQFNTSWAFNTVKQGAQTSKGKDIDLTMNLIPARTLRLQSRYAISDSGALSALNGFNSGFGTGYDGNGFSGGTNPSIGTGSTNFRLFSVGLDYNPSARIGLNVGYRENRQTGSVSANATTKALGGSLGFDFGRGTRMSLSADRSDTTYVGSVIRSGATSYSVNLDGAPPGRFSYNLGYTKFLTSGNSNFRQNSAATTGRMAYQVAPRHAFSADFNIGKTSGYLPQDGSEWGLTYSYQIWRSLSFNTSYRFRNIRSLDPLVSSGAYRSNSLDFELAFDFGR